MYIYYSSFQNISTVFTQSHPFLLKLHLHTRSIYLLDQYDEILGIVFGSKVNFMVFMEIKSQMKTVNYIFEILNGKKEGKKIRPELITERIKIKHKHTHRKIAINTVSNELKQTFVLT